MLFKLSHAPCSIDCSMQLQPNALFLSSDAWSSPAFSIHFTALFRLWQVPFLSGDMWMIWMTVSLRSVVGARISFSYFLLFASAHLTLSREDYVSCGATCACMSVIMGDYVLCTCFWRAKMSSSSSIYRYMLSSISH